MIGKRIAIQSSRIALLTRVELGVSAEEREEATVFTTFVREIGIMRRGFTLFTEELLYDAIAAATCLQEALRIAPIKIACVAIVALLINRENTIAADLCGSRLEVATVRATIPFRPITVVTFLTRIQLPIAARITGGQRPLEETTRRAPIAPTLIPVITCFKVIENPVATMDRDTDVIDALSARTLRAPRTVDAVTGGAEARCTLRGIGAFLTMTESAGIAARIRFDDVAVVALLALLEDRIAAPRYLIVERAEV